MNIEEFVNYYLQNYRHEVLLNPYNGLVEFAKVFQEKLMEDAKEGKIIFLLNGDMAVNIGDTDKYNLGQKVRVIVLPKEDEK